MEARSREETLKMEARTKQLVEAERENLLSQLSQLIPNFDPSMLKPKTCTCQNQGQEQSPKNPMSDKASCSGLLMGDHLQSPKNPYLTYPIRYILGMILPRIGKSRMKWNLEKQDEEKKDEEKQDEKNIEVVDYPKLEMPSSLQSLCRYVEMTLKPLEKTMIFTIEKEVFGDDRSTFVLHEDITHLQAWRKLGLLWLQYI
ncbi:unnamed protein product [Prunus armeniaca]